MAGSSARRPERPGATRAIELELAPAAAAPSLGRRALERLAGRLEPDRLADVELIASELLTNAVVHSGLDESALMHLRVELSDDTVRVEVEDPGQGFAPRPVPPGGGAGGHGLRLVDRVADRWGISRGGTTLVWAELERTGPAGGGALGPSAG